MAVTHGHGNPDWARDEILLALDLYFQLEGKIPGPTDAHVVQLSAVLRSLPIHMESLKNSRFRNADGVAFKLQNIRQIATGQGLGNVSAADKAVWADYGDKPDLVRELSDRIRAQASDSEVAAEEVARIGDDEEFVEGKLMTALHRIRERNPKLRVRLLRKRRERGMLSCDACGDGPKVVDNNLQESGFEGHHVVPLALSMERKSKVEDMALLCATCHRLIHRAMHMRRGWVTVEAFRELLAPAGGSTMRA